jgi:succinoglycan biosynthesis protein ExoM
MPVHSTARGPRVCVAIPTYCRPESLTALLQALRAQTAWSTVAARVVVFDNDPEGSAAATIRAFGGEDLPALEYVLVPNPGLSSVRNAALLYARDQFDFLAMIDDDEVPDPAWLLELLEMQVRCSADAVVGPVPHVLPPGTPRWIANGRFFAFPEYRNGAMLDDGYSGNCLLSLRAIAAAGLTFDMACNLAGGEDQLFFRQLSARGYRIVFARHAIATETIGAERLAIGYLVRRAFRRGNSLWICDLKIHGTTRAMARRIIKGLGRIALGLACVVPRCTIRGQTGLVESYCEVAFGLGMLVGIFGVTVLEYERGTKPVAAPAIAVHESRT